MRDELMLGPAERAVLECLRAWPTPFTTAEALEAGATFPPGSRACGCSRWASSCGPSFASPATGAWSSSVPSRLLSIRGPSRRGRAFGRDWLRRTEGWTIVVARKHNVYGHHQDVAGLLLAGAAAAGITLERR